MVVCDEWYERFVSGGGFFIGFRMEGKKGMIMFVHGGEVFADRGEVPAYLREKRQFRDPFWNPDGRTSWRENIARRYFGRADILMPEMPNKIDARYAEWEAWFDRHVPLFRDGVILVGSSLGGIFLAKYLAVHALSVRVGLLALVSAPFDDEADGPLGDFRLPDDLEDLARQTDRIILFHSSDDPVVPVAELGKYARALSGAEAVVLDGRGHFFVEEFPELSDRIGQALDLYGSV